jgi:hypothetical protein
MVLSFAVTENAPEVYYKDALSQKAILKQFSMLYS